MKKIFRSLNFALVIFVFILMLFSSVLAGLILIILSKLNIFAQIESAAILFLIVGLIVSIIIGVLLAFPVGHYLLKPLNELIDATREVSKGNFDVKAKEIEHNFGVGELIKSFNNMTKELSSIEVFRKDFVSSVSHEFNTPIASIQGFAKLLQKKDLSLEKREEYTSIIIEESSRLSNLSSNILRLSRLEHEKINESKTLFYVDEQIRKSILLLEHMWNKKNIEFKIDLDELTYMGDENLLQQVWVNLISNAIKFSPENKTIDIELIQLNDKIRCKITDYGIGMTKKTSDRIFEEFYQGDLSHSQEGNGLGLPLVKSILELHGGNIHVESKVNEGSIFTVELAI
ncbi:MAG TPA: HAMP domain-containing sensor histidine kinase [Tissierellaceae bacterium]|nr:HAMP domain-containing sensor histidine kinase [Tissierellaceae bacterium]